MKKLGLIIIAILSFTFSKAQTTIITDDSTYTQNSTNAIMEIHSLNGNKGILIPRLTTAQRTAISTSAVNDNSLLVYDTDTKTFWYFDGTAWVEIATGGTVTDDQLLTFSNDTLYIENGNSVYLGAYLDNTDNQILSFNNSTGVLTISNGNSVTIPLSSGGDNWGSQSVVSDATLSGNGTSSNPLTVVGDLTDNQNISGSGLSGTTLTIGIENGTNETVDLSSLQDGTGTDDQNIQGSGLSGNNLTIGIENGTSQTIDLSQFMDNTDNQNLSLSGTTINITNGTGVDISSAITSTAWSLTGNSGTTAGTNFLGTTDNISLSFKTNNTERMRILNSGNVGIGTTSPTYPLTVTNGTADRVGSFVSTEASADNYGVYGECATTDYYGYGGYFVGGFIGVRGVVTATGANSYYGVYGSVSGGTGNNYGVYGSSDGDDGFGVYAYNSDASGTGLIAVGNGASGSYLTNGVGVAATGDVGVYGKSSNTSGTGIAGAGNNGSLTTLTNGSGISGTGNVIGVAGFSTATGNDSWGGYFSAVNNSQYAYVGGQYSGTDYKINGSGTVSTIVKRPDGTRANMFCPEAPEILFQDYGIGKLVNGRAHITIDPILAKNIVVNSKHPLRVFIQLEGDCKGVYVTNKTQNGFDVVELQNGNSNVEFSWTIVANRADTYDEQGNRISKNADIRFPDGPGPMPIINKKAKQIKQTTKIK